MRQSGAVYAFDRDLQLKFAAEGRDTEADCGDEPEHKPAIELHHCLGLGEGQASREHSFYRSCQPHTQVLAPDELNQVLQ